MIRYLHHLFLEVGREISVIWIFPAAIIIWVSFPVAVFCASIVAAYWLTQWLGIGIWLLFATAIILAVFLFVYVWYPYVRPAADRAAKAILENP